MLEPIVALVLEWCAANDSRYADWSKKNCIEYVADCTIKDGKLLSHYSDELSTCIKLGRRKLKIERRHVQR